MELPESDRSSCRYALNPFLYGSHTEDGGLKVYDLGLEAYGFFERHLCAFLDKLYINPVLGHMDAVD